MQRLSTFVICYRKARRKEKGERRKEKGERRKEKGKKTSGLSQKR
jgi:hypothetical protein